MLHHPYRVNFEPCTHTHTSILVLVASVTKLGPSVPAASIRNVNAPGPLNSLRRNIRVACANLPHQKQAAHPLVRVIPFRCLGHNLSYRNPLLMDTRFATFFLALFYMFNLHGLSASMRGIPGSSSGGSRPFRAGSTHSQQSASEESGSAFSGLSSTDESWASLSASEDDDNELVSFVKP